MYLLLAQAIASDTTVLGWMVSSLTTISSLLIVVTAALIFLGAYYLVSNKRPVSSLASYLVLLPLPLLVSICGWIYGSIRSLAAMAATPDLTITSQEIAGGLAASLLSVLFALLVSMPGYMILAYGLIARDFRTPRQGAEIANSVGKSTTLSSIDANAIPIIQ